MNRNALKIKEVQKSEIATIRFLRGKTARGIAPFVSDDSTAGMEYELQVAVEGSHETVDLPLKILDSNYYKNIVKRTDRGDLSGESLEALETFFYKNQTKVWENSWVRLPQNCLSPSTRAIVDHDFLADKQNPAAGQRTDLHRFLRQYEQPPSFRLPISYVLKLSLAEIISEAGLPQPIKEIGSSLFANLVSDNTSPEVLSFTIPRAGRQRIGDMAAAETARTLLSCQLLVQYANKAFHLEESGQRCLLYFAPHAPIRQRQLNDIVPDGFYRHLFMSPCLSGWDKGEEKHHYMALCHKTLSRSQLNTISKLKDAGILTNNLVIIPNTSNTCLANNGTHVSLGSNVLTRLAGNPNSGFTPQVEKYCGDLVIKIVEHFLPLFVGSYSAAPYRIDFRDFHPENVLGFLPHELDFTHLRMIWRRWKKKAKNNFFGHALTPFGPRWLDTLLARSLQLKGDIVPDFRLVDYLIALLSTESSPGLDGAPDNHDKLRQELMEEGVFDSRMSIYLFYRQRIMASSGYAGFEGRSYSLFHSIMEDMAEAVDMQNLVTALAYKYVLDESICHRDIPDIPSIESERRQIFFGSAIGIPTFYVRTNTTNRFMRKILSHVSSCRKSNRYRGYLRVKNRDYRMALLRVLREDGAGLIEQLDMTDRLQRLERKLGGDMSTAHDAIIGGITSLLDHTKSPLTLAAETFNGAAERYFREDLRGKHTGEGLDVLISDCGKLEKMAGSVIPQVMSNIDGCSSATAYIAGYRNDILNERCDAGTVRNLLLLCLAVIHDQQQNGNTL